MKLLKLILIASLIIFISCDKSQIDNYYFATSGKDTLLLFPSNEIILQRKGKSYYFDMHFYTDKKYDDIKNKNSFFIYLLEDGSKYKVYDGRIRISRDDATQKISFLDLCIFDCNFLLEEEYEFEMLSQTYFCFDYTDNYKEKARQLLFKVREQAEIIKRLDNDL